MEPEDVRSCARVFNGNKPSGRKGVIFHLSLSLGGVERARRACVSRCYTAGNRCPMIEFARGHGGNPSSRMLIVNLQRSSPPGPPAAISGSPVVHYAATLTPPPRRLPVSDEKRKEIKSFAGWRAISHAGHVLPPDGARGAAAIAFRRVNN